MAWSSCPQGATQGSRVMLEDLRQGRVGIPKAHTHEGLTPHPVPAGSYQACLKPTSGLLRLTPRQLAF